GSIKLIGYSGVLTLHTNFGYAAFIYFRLDRGRDARCAGVPQDEGTLRVSRRIIVRFTNTNGRPVNALHLGGRFVSCRSFLELPRIGRMDLVESELARIKLTGLVSWEGTNNRSIRTGRWKPAGDWVGWRAGNGRRGTAGAGPARR